MTTAYCRSRLAWGRLARGRLARGEFLDDIAIANGNGVELAKLGLQLENLVMGDGKFVGLVGDII